MRYKLFLIDLWGVIHDGTKLYPGVIDALQSIQKSGAKIIFISNAPRRAFKAKELLLNLGVSENLFDGIITSGECFYIFAKFTLAQLSGQNQNTVLKHSSQSKNIPQNQDIKPNLQSNASHSLQNEVQTQDNQDNKKICNDAKNIGGFNVPKVFYIGPDEDLDVLDSDQADVDGLEICLERDSVEGCKFIMLTGFEYYNQPIEELMPKLEKCRKNDIILYCLNPDLVVVKQDGSSEQCAGVIAKHYSDMGGKVVYFGKPYNTIYKLACFIASSGKSDAVGKWSFSLDRIIDEATFEDAFMIKNIHQKQNVFIKNDASQGLLQKEQIVAIGDSLNTDVKGAIDFSIDSCFVTEGIYKKEIAQLGSIEKLFDKYDLKPTYSVRFFKDIVDLFK